MPFIQQFQYQIVATPPPVAVAVPLRSWTPTLVDLVPRSRAVIPQTDVLSVSTASLTPSLAWSPTYASVVATRLGVATTTLTPAVTAPFELARGWGSTFADAIRTQVPQQAQWCARPEQSAVPPPPLSWGPQFADRAPGPRPLPDWQTLGLWPYPVPVTTDQLSWRPAFPDRHAYRQPAEHQAFVTGSTASSVPIASPLAWQGVWPARTPAPPRASDFPGFAFYPVPLVAALTPLSWGPDFADQIVRLPVVLQVNVKPIGFVPTIVPWAVPKFPGLLLGRPVTPPPAAVYPATATLPTLTPLAWRPTFTDQHTFLRAPEFAAFATGATASAFPVVARAWAPEYADVAPAAKRAAEYPAFAFDPVPFTTTVDQMGWRGSYADWIARLRLAEHQAFATGSTASSLPLPSPLAWCGTWADVAPAARRDFPAFALYPVPLTLSVDQLAWRGVSADWIARRLPVEYPAFVTGSTASSLPVASLSWQPAFADVARGPRRVADLLAHAFWPQPLAGTPALAWQGVWPDRLFRNGTTLPDPLAAPLAQATIPLLTGWLPSQNGPRSLLRWPLWHDLVAPVAQATVPLLVAWRGAYPDRLAVRIVVESHRAERIAFTTVPTAFEVAYPDILLPTVRVNGGRFEIPDWEVLRPTAPTRAWAGAYPDFARGLRPLPVGALLSLGMPGGVAPIILFGPISARFRTATTGQPYFGEATTTQPRMIRWTTGQPDFTGEENK